MLNVVQRKQIATTVNKSINIPWVPENFEQSIFEHAVGLVDDAIDMLVPHAIVELVVSSAAGVTRGSVGEFGERLIAALNKRIDIPYLNEEQEDRLIRTVVGVILKAMTIGHNIVTVTGEPA